MMVGGETVVVLFQEIKSIMFECNRQILIERSIYIYGTLYADNLYVPVNLHVAELVIAVLSGTPISLLSMYKGMPRGSMHLLVLHSRSSSRTSSCTALMRECNWHSPVD